jgi:hypothetical protein
MVLELPRAKSACLASRLACQCVSAPPSWPDGNRPRGLSARLCALLCGRAVSAASDTYENSDTMSSFPPLGHLHRSIDRSQKGAVPLPPPAQSASICVMILGSSCM